MEIRKIRKISVIETNPYADPDTCRNGGGYFQPEITVMLDNGHELVITDGSCGDFGSRIEAVYQPIGGDPLHKCRYGTMYQVDEAYSTFPPEFSALFDAVWLETGYSLPIEADFEADPDF